MQVKLQVSTYEKVPNRSGRNRKRAFGRHIGIYKVAGSKREDEETPRRKKPDEHYPNCPTGSETRRGIERGEHFRHADIKGYDPLLYPKKFITKDIF